VPAVFLVTEFFLLDVADVFFNDVFDALTVLLSEAAFVLPDRSQVTTW